MRHQEIDPDRLRERVRKARLEAEAQRNWSADLRERSVELRDGLTWLRGAARPPVRVR
jgi:hypothetical protein